MEQNNYKRFVPIGIVVALVIFIGIVGYLVLFKPSNVEFYPSPPATQISVDSERSFVEGYSSDVPEGIEISQAEEISREGLPSLKKFTITGEGGTFSPQEIVVKKDDRVQLTFEAVDGTYDFVFINFKIPIFKIVEEGQSASVGFDANDPGIYTFKCTAFCEDASGRLIVLE